MIQIHDITRPYPWPDAEVRYFDAPEASFGSTALEENWLNAKANARGRQVINYMLLPTGEYEVHMSAALYRVKQVQFELFADHFDLGLEHDFLLGLSPDMLPGMGVYKADCGGYYFHMMEVADNIRMGTRSKAISQWIDEHSEWMYWYDHYMLCCQENPKSKPMPVTTAYAISKGKNPGFQDLKK